MESTTGMKNSQTFNISIGQLFSFKKKTNCLPSDEEEDKGGCFCKELNVKRTIVMNENI